MNPEAELEGKQAIALMEAKTVSRNARLKEAALGQEDSSWRDVTSVLGFGLIAFLLYKDFPSSKGFVLVLAIFQFFLLTHRVAKLEKRLEAISKLLVD